MCVCVCVCEQEPNVCVCFQHPCSVYGRMSTASRTDSGLNPNQCDSVQEASGHNPSEPMSSKSNQDEGTHTHIHTDTLIILYGKFFHM